jgi:hypothetical protein
MPWMAWYREEDALQVTMSIVYERSRARTRGVLLLGYYDSNRDLAFSFSIFSTENRELS